MNQNHLVSVIVPIYKVESYLPRCIESIINQTYKNLEIFLVDDGSPDNCGRIADEYAHKDLRIKVLHKENGGLSDARNYALDFITGEYVTFIDSDDTVDPKYIEILVDLISKSNTNVSMVGYQIFDDNMSISVYDGGPFEKVIYSQEKALQKALKVQLMQSAWGKLYKRQIFKDLRFPKGMLYEDLAIFYDVIDMSNGIAYIDLPLYKYYLRSDSIMRQPFKIQQMDEVEIIDTVMAKLEYERSDLHYLINARKIYSYFLVLSRILSANDKDKYLKQKNELKNKIKSCKKGLLWKRNVKLSWKIRLLSFNLGDKCFYTVDRVINYMLQLRYQHKRSA